MSKAIADPATLAPSRLERRAAVSAASNAAMACDIRAHIHITLVRADRERSDGHALDERERIALHQHAVGEGAESPSSALHDVLRRRRHRDRATAPSGAAAGPGGASTRPALLPLRGQARSGREAAKGAIVVSDRGSITRSGRRRAASGASARRSRPRDRGSADRRPPSNSPASANASTSAGSTGRTRRAAGVSISTIGSSQQRPRAADDDDIDAAPLAAAAMRAAAVGADRNQPASRGMKTRTPTAALRQQRIEPRTQPRDDAAVGIADGASAQRPRQ